MILSANSSLPEAPSEEVADVTVTVAALVDGGMVSFPQGLRKERLLGVWGSEAGRGGCRKGAEGLGIPLGIGTEVFRREEREELVIVCEEGGQGQCVIDDETWVKK